MHLTAAGSGQAVLHRPGCWRRTAGARAAPQLPEASRYLRSCWSSPRRPQRAELMDLGRRLLGRAQVLRACRS